MRPTCQLAFVSGLLLAACSDSSDRDPAAPPVKPSSEATPRFLRASERDGRTIEGLSEVRDVSVADLDGDGEADVVAARASGIVTVAWGGLQNGQPETTDLQLNAGGEWTAVADVDLDGDLDLILPAGPGQLVALWLQVAPRVFEPGAALSLPGELISAVVVADLNGDGSVDLAGARQGQNLLLHGDGTGGFSDVSGLLPFDGRTSTVVSSGYLLGGAQPELVFGGVAGMALLRNDGAAYSDVTVVATGQEWQTRDVKVADVDADGFPDLLMRLPYDVVWLKADGVAGFSVAQTFEVGSGDPSTGLIDDDMDEDLDLVVSGFGAIKLFRFDGASQSFLPAPDGTIPGDLSNVARVLAWSDLDGDGDPEIVLGRALEILWRVGVAGTYFRDEQLVLPGYYVQTAGQSAVIAGDYDADGDTDLHTTSSGTGGSFAQLHRNDGAARFSSAAGVVTTPWAMADVNADGWPDILAQQWHAGDGAGGFGPGQDWPIAGHSGVGDFDGDGVQEVLMIADGSATLLEPAPGGPIPGVSTPVATPTSITVADVNLDGIDDFVAVLGAVQTGLFFGTSTGVFEDRASSLPTDVDFTAAVAVGDWEGDGDIDIIAARVLGGSPSEYARIYLNDGTNQFAIGPGLISTEPAPLSLDGIAAADVDEDGRIEVFVQLQLTSFQHSADLARTEVFEAVDAGGAVRQVAAELAGVDGAARYAGFSSSVSRYAPTFVDLDGDLDLDFVGSSVRINGLRDLTIQPRGRFGKTLAVQVVDRAYVPDEVAIVYLGLLPAQTVIPGLGSMLMDPSLALLAIADVAAGSGSATVEFALPAITLPGTTTVYAQAMLLDGNGAVRAVTTRAQSLVW